MTNFVKLYLINGDVKTVGSLPNERLDINLQGAYVAVGRGPSCGFKELMTEVSKIVFINNHEGPDVELIFKTIMPDERNRLIENEVQR